MIKPQYYALFRNADAAVGENDKIFFLQIKALVI